MTFPSGSSLGQNRRAYGFVDDDYPRIALSILLADISAS
jgi:hypothetical protein